MMTPAAHYLLIFFVLPCCVATETNNDDHDPSIRAGTGNQSFANLNLKTYFFSFCYETTC